MTDAMCRSCDAYRPRLRPNTLLMRKTYCDRYRHRSDPASHHLRLPRLPSADHRGDAMLLALIGVAAVGIIVLLCDL